MVREGGQIFTAEAYDIQVASCGTSIIASDRGLEQPKRERIATTGAVVRNRTNSRHRRCFERVFVIMLFIARHTSIVKYASQLSSLTNAAIFSPPPVHYHRQKKRKNAHHEDALGGPLVQVVDPRPRPGVEPPEGEEDVHLFAAVGAGVAEHSRVGLVAAVPGKVCRARAVCVPDITYICTRYIFL